jgi:hypothetical protein
MARENQKIEKSSQSYTAQAAILLHQVKVESYSNSFSLVSFAFEPK